jgi:hypothetical protein
LKRGAAPAETKTDAANSPAPATSEVEIRRSDLRLRQSAGRTDREGSQRRNSGAKVQLSNLKTEQGAASSFR